MALTLLEIALVESAMESFMARRRPPVAMRSKVDLHFKIEDQNVLIYEIRPYWRDKTRLMESPVAKATFVRSTKRWRVYWRRADLQWHSYDPSPEVDGIEEFLALVETDQPGCFWG